MPGRLGQSLRHYEQSLLSLLPLTHPHAKTSVSLRRASPIQYHRCQAARMVRPTQGITCRVEEVRLGRRLLPLQTGRADFPHPAFPRISTEGMHEWSAYQGHARWGVRGRDSIGRDWLRGGFALFALQQFVQVPGVRLVAMAGTHRESAIAAAKRFGVEGVEEVDTLLARPDVDLAYIATPPFLHHEQALRALVAGKHVICEKPLAMNVGQPTSCWPRRASVTCCSWPT